MVTARRLINLIHSRLANPFLQYVDFVIRIDQIYTHVYHSISQLIHCTAARSPYFTGDSSFQLLSPQRSISGDQIFRISVGPSRYAELTCSRVSVYISNARLYFLLTSFCVSRPLSGSHNVK